MLAVVVSGFGGRGGRRGCRAAPAAGAMVAVLRLSPSSSAFADGPAVSVASSGAAGWRVRRNRRDGI